MKLRVSFIDFLNSVPLGWSFLHGAHQDAFELLFDVPSECARHLKTGEADVGLIPVIEYQRIPGLRVLPDISISSRQEVRSVLFASRKPLDQVRRIAIDTSSRTSVALLKIVLERFHALTDVSYHPHPPDPLKMLREFEAALIIGNPALQVPLESVTILDLAQEWNRFTGLPFVFAFWGVAGGVDLGSQFDLFYTSKAEGLRQVDEIARLYSQRLGLQPSEIKSYLMENLDYSLDQSNLEGLQLFYKLAAEMRLVPALRSLEFYAPQPVFEGS